MDIKLIKGESRNRLICVREDGSLVQSDLGPRIPYHDLAHYAAEKTLGIKDGFFGNIKSGYSLEQLSDKKVIKRLGTDSLLAEVLARTLQLLSSAACTKEEFPRLIRQEMEMYSIKVRLELSRSNVNRMLKLYDALLEEWTALPEGETLEIEF